ncbi:Uncharacterised protein [Vibrio cholerae]|nr:Uncharacterised protein [Vibrio cholerae]
MALPRFSSSFCAMVFEPRKPKAAILSRLAYSASKPPIPCKSAVAVFSPTPGTPGMLSTLSPIKAR